MADQDRLVERILAGDDGAFRQLIVQHQRLVSHIVFRLVPSEADREDICQEVFVRVYQHLDTFRFDAKLSTWIARIAYNTCLNFLEKRKLPLYDDLVDEDRPLDPAAPDEISRPDYALEAAETGRTVQRAIERLPPVYKAIVTLFHLEQMSYSEIADIMDMPEGTVKSYLFRARKMLKDKLLTQYQREEL